jgi:hypothetical protein
VERASAAVAERRELCWLESEEAAWWRAWARVVRGAVWRVPVVWMVAVRAARAVVRVVGEGGGEGEVVGREGEMGGRWGGELCDDIMFVN